jgi:hypothetical protein
LIWGINQTPCLPQSHTKLPNFSAAVKALLAQPPMAGYSEINVDELFPSDDSMAIIVAQSKPLTAVPSKDIIVMPPKEVRPVHHRQSYYAQAMLMLRLSPPPSRLSIEGPCHQ